MKTTWTRLIEAFEGSRDLRESERRAYLAELLGDDAAAIQRVEAMVRADASPDLPVDRRLQTLAESLLEEGPPAPERIGPYRIVGTLGRGGMGVVYRGLRPDLERTDAIKVLYGTFLSPLRRQLFLREQRLLASLTHPSIARIYDAGSLEDGTPYFVMEEIAGQPLDAAAEHRGLSLQERVELFLRVCDAVQHAHVRGIIHSDLKMSNLLVLEEGEPARVKLLDFGIARRLGDSSASEPGELAEPSLTAYTPAYASPEQVKGEPATILTDVYALGVLLYELLAGRRPPAAQDRLRDTASPLPPPSASERRLSARPPVWRELDAICARALALEPNERYGSVTALYEDLRAFLDHRPVAARPATTGYVLGKFARRHRASVVLATLAALLLAGATGAVFVQSLRVSAERDRAELERAAAEQVKEFMLDIFRASDPALVRGGELRARDLLDNAAAALLSPSETQPPDRVRFLYAITRAYDHLGLYEEQAELLRAALATEELDRRAAPPSATILRAELAGALLQLGKLDEAEALLESAQDLATNDASVPTKDRLAIDSKVAHLRWVQGSLDESEDIFLRVIDALEPKDGGKPTQRYLECLANLGAVYSHQGRFGEAEDIYQRAIGAMANLVGHDHPRTLLQRGNLATLRLRQERYGAARETLVPLLDDKRRVLGAEHVDTLRSVNGLAVAEHQLGNLDEAEALFREALLASEKIHPSLHPETLALQANLAAVLGDQGKTAEAREVHRHVYKAFQGRFGTRHRYTALGLHNLAGANAQAGDLDLAQRQYREAQEILGEVLPASHPELAMNLEAWADLERRRGAVERATELAARAREIRENVP